MENTIEIEIEMEDENSVCYPTGPASCFYHEAGGFNRSAHSAGLFLVPRVLYMRGWELV